MFLYPLNTCTFMLPIARAPLGVLSFCTFCYMLLYPFYMVNVSISLCDSFVCCAIYYYRVYACTLELGVNLSSISQSLRVYMGTKEVHRTRPRWAILLHHKYITVCTDHCGPRLTITFELFKVGSMLSRHSFT